MGFRSKEVAYLDIQVITVNIARGSASSVASGSASFDARHKLEL